MLNVIRISLLYILAITFSVIGESCFPGNCESPGTIYYRITDMNVNGSVQQTSKGERNRFDIIPDLEQQMQVSAESPGFFIGTAMATEPCPPPLMLFVNPIDSLHVTTDKTFSSALGQDLTGAFSSSFSGPSMEYNQLTQLFTGEKYWYDRSIYLIERPDQSDTFRFTFRFFDIDGQEFTSTSEPIFISAD